MADKIYDENLIRNDEVDAFFTETGITGAELDAFSWEDFCNLVDKVEDYVAQKTVSEKKTELPKTRTTTDETEQNLPSPDPEEVPIIDVPSIDSCVCLSEKLALPLMASPDLPCTRTPIDPESEKVVQLQTLICEFPDIEKGVDFQEACDFSFKPGELKTDSCDGVFGDSRNIFGDPNLFTTALVLGDDTVEPSKPIPCRSNSLEWSAVFLPFVTFLPHYVFGLPRKFWIAFETPPWRCHSKLTSFERDLAHDLAHRISVSGFQVVDVF